MRDEWVPRERAVCCVDGCDRVVSRRGLCLLHARQHGQKVRSKRQARPARFRAPAPRLRNRDTVKEVTASELRQTLSYDGETGVFRWRNSGAVAGSLGHLGYVVIKIHGLPYVAHRLAWLYVRGRWPVLHIDHINMERADNRIANLREATPSQNQANTRRPRDKKYDAPKGVRREPNGKWSAHIKHSRRNWYLGTFSTLEEAFEARVKAATAAFGSYARNE